MSQEKKCVMCAKETANFYIDGENGSVCLACAEKLGKYAKKVKDELSEYDDAVKINLMKPSELMKELNQHIIGQEGAKKAVCTAVYNHYKRVLNKKDSDVEVGKSNILMLGPTASGKTEIARVLARTLGVPFCIVDAQTFTAAGFVGADIQTMITKLYHAADENIKACETGIIFVDEIDKVATRHMGPGLSGRNPGAEGMQQAFLKIVEGTKESFPPDGGRIHPEQKLIEVDTTNILFICAGAFVGLTDIIKERVKKGNNIGFGSVAVAKDSVTDEELMDQLTTEDVVKFGLIPELVGRLPKIVTLKHLTQENLKDIFVKPKNSIMKQYIQLLKYDKCDLEFSDDAIDKIAELAMKNKTGARGLRSITEKILDDIMFEIPDNPTERFTITKDHIETGTCVLNKSEQCREAV